MKLLQEFKNRLHKTSPISEDENTIDPFDEFNTLDTDTSSNDEDMFLFI
ncbi:MULTISPECIES: hypothetical protein [Winogradskyella]|uniref:Uncharacterized protein n=2 Tax=Winogradskyella TaxID=286104 RepID=A0A368ZFY8_9FLAO|nr:hypothetical protein [Winogradskyella arenosi]RCW92392.1 hypothetical protein DFQ08_102416 [Winogradskyella arenosi]